MDYDFLASQVQIEDAIKARDFDRVLMLFTDLQAFLNKTHLNYTRVRVQLTEVVTRLEHSESERDTLRAQLRNLDEENCALRAYARKLVEERDRYAKDLVTVDSHRTAIEKRLRTYEKIKTIPFAKSEPLKTLAVDDLASVDNSSTSEDHMLQFLYECMCDALAKKND